MSNATRTVAIMCFSGGTGGMERSAVRLARFLSLITEVVLVCKKGSFVEKLHHKENRNIKCEAIGFISRTFSLSMLIKARSVINRHDVGNVIFFGASELKTLYFSFLGKDINLVVWHGTTKSKPKRDFFHNLVYSNVDYHVALSRHLIGNVKNIVPVNEKVIYKVIYPSFDFDVRVDKKEAGNECIEIAHVGRLAEGKGQLDAVHACKILKESDIDFRLTLIGSAETDNYINRIHDAIDQYSLEEYVTITGYVESVNQYLENTDILLFPSRGEGMPNAFIEALHYPIVCIAYDNTVFPEFIDMGFYVHLQQDGNIDALSRCLLQVAEDLKEEKSKVKNNIKLAKEYFSVDRELRDWEDILV